MTRPPSLQKAGQSLESPESSQYLDPPVRTHAGLDESRRVCLWPALELLARLYFPQRSRRRCRHRQAGAARCHAPSRVRQRRGTRPSSSPRAEGAAGEVGWRCAQREQKSETLGVIGDWPAAPPRPARSPVPHVPLPPAPQTHHPRPPQAAVRSHSPQPPQCAPPPPPAPPGPERRSGPT